MTYKRYKIALIIRVITLFLLLTALAFSLVRLDAQEISPLKTILAIFLAAISVYSVLDLFNFIFKRFSEMDDFFESIKYRDFSRHFNETYGAEDIRILHKHFNNVNKTIVQINKEKEEQHLYLKKILELINTGIIAYNIESGNVLWVNESFKKTLNIPSLKNISFVEKRNTDLYRAIFMTDHHDETHISVNISNEKTKLLISSSIFLTKEGSFKLIVLQNIDETLNKNESEAWKKLLSVMTHEIMNSIAPISSLAETLQSKVALFIEDSNENPIDMSDLDIGIESIKKRSEGLLKFAKTFRSLNKITKLNLSKISVADLFETIKTLMLPSLESKDIKLLFKTENPELQIEIDIYLLEQVLINLILNAVEACKDRLDSKVIITAQKNIDGKTIIKISDNGKGIPNDVIENVFVPFFTTKKTGSGIGLSLCKQIMLLHKGNILINSIEEKGTSVKLIFNN
ncbi:ATP-binding protein [uncultured Algibacter sp.]|uniref:sensor histidine kinase n=1 Tax=uncultured Algibacter sp. TaxID=298659 RepID=UPI00260E3C08|nr:ATP-binding protein [uncultured Algibacter sp.]